MTLVVVVPAVSSFASVAGDLWLDVMIDIVSQHAGLKLWAPCGVQYEYDHTAHFVLSWLCCRLFTSCVAGCWGF